MEGYLTLASHQPKLTPYELPQTIAQIPAPPINVPMPIRKALSIEGENKTIHYLLCGEYELNNTSWSKLQQKYNISHNTMYTALTGKRRPSGSQYHQKRKRSTKQEPIATTLSYQTNDKFYYVVGIPFTMMTFMLIGLVHFMGNILLAWATLQQPYVTKSLLLPPPQNKNDWVHSVIFEPQPKMQLTRSSHKITSFLDFQPFLQGFQSVDNYIKDLITDINNPSYFQKLIAPFHDRQVTPLSTHDNIRTFLSSPECHSHAHACQAKMKFEQFCIEINYVYKVFRAIYKKFLTANDHIDYHPSQQVTANTTRVKRCSMYIQDGQYSCQTRELNPSEESFLDAFLKALYKINPLLHNNLSHMKRTGIFTWLLGLGVFTNARSISQIKDNLPILQKQNQLQDKQIKQLAKYLNLTMLQVNRNSEMLYEIDTKVFIINSTIHHLIWHFDAMRYETNILHYFQTRISRVHTSLYALHGDTDSLFEYMRILASQELTPPIIPPDILKGILHKIEEEIKSNARVRLCEDPETNIWSYYRTVKLTPIVLQDYLMLILTVHLLDQSLHITRSTIYPCYIQWKAHIWQQ